MTGARGLEMDMFKGGCVPRHGGDKGIGYNEGGMGFGVGGGERNAGPHRRRKDNQKMGGRRSRER